MPKPVKLGKGREFEFKSAKPGSESKYDWASWFNPDPAKFPNGLVMLVQSTGKKDAKGTVVEVDEKGDYDIDTNGMVPKLKNAARRFYKNIKVSRFGPDGEKLEGALIFKVSDMTSEERTAEDVLRAEEKEAAADRREKSRVSKTPDAAEAA